MFLDPVCRRMQSGLATAQCPLQSLILPIIQRQVSEHSSRLNSQTTDCSSAYASAQTRRYGQHLHKTELYPDQHRGNTLVDTVKCGTFTEVFARATVTVKTATLTLRIDPSEIEALRIAAGQEHRSIVNMVEILILSNCERHVIAIPPFEETKSNNGAYS